MFTRRTTELVLSLLILLLWLWPESFCIPHPLLRDINSTATHCPQELNALKVITSNRYITNLTITL